MNTKLDTLNGADWQRMFINAATSVAAHVDELTALDNATGDGDHGVNVTRAFEHLRLQVEELENPTPSAVLTTAAESFFNEMGGAAGALFGSFFQAAARSVSGLDEVNATRFADAIESGADNVTMRGKANIGDKTMVDALIPAAKASRVAASDGRSTARALRMTAQAARQGAEATTAMAASIGRARFSAEKARGVQDPGATTVALIFEAWADACAERDET